MSGRREVAVGLGCYAAYLAVRRRVWNDEGRARAHRNAARIVAAERALGIHIEPTVQRWALAAPRLVDALNAGYAAGNVALSVGWLIVLFRRNDAGFARERTAAVLAFAGALPAFLAFPTAPPRSQDGFVDTLASRGIDLDHPLLVRVYNPIAAMPSHHMAFATVSGLGLAARRRSHVGRQLWRGYPPAVGAVVLATGNHYVLDVLAGAALGRVARALARGLLR